MKRNKINDIKKIVSVVLIGLLPILLASCKTEYKEKPAFYKKAGENTNIKETHKKDETDENRYIYVPTGGAHYVDGILIVNKTYPLPKEYDPGGLLPEVVKAFEAMREQAHKEGIELQIISGFRSYDRQSEIYRSYADRDGEKKADRYSARAGHSEHQTGLAMDINSVKNGFEHTKEGKWLEAHCFEFGFIIRYPKDKEAETGYMYEPWHIRYVGIETAKSITLSGMCLEEYLGVVSAYELGLSK